MEPKNFPIQLSAEPIDAATQELLDEARADIERGEVYSLEESNEIVRKQYQEWRKIQQEILVG